MRLKKSLVYSQLLEVSEQSYYRWKNKHHPKLITFLETCFSNEDIDRYNETGTIPFYIAKKDDFYHIEHQRYVKLFLAYEENLYPFYLLINDFFDKCKESKLNSSFFEFRKYLFQCLKVNIISIDDLNSFFEIQEKIIEVWDFIKDNIILNWNILEQKINEHENKWIIIYHDMLFLAAKKKIYRKVFLSVNIDDNDYNLIPPHPKPFVMNIPKNNNVLSYLYELLDVLEVIEAYNVGDTLELEKYSFMDTFLN